MTEPATGGLRPVEYAWFPDLTLLEADDTGQGYDPRYDDYLWMWTPTIRWRGGDRWTIQRGEAHSPMPLVWCEDTREWERDHSSGRTDEFMARTRYTLDEAKRIVERLAGELVEYLTDNNKLRQDWDPTYGN